jgi:hypothetical protein
MYRYKLCRNTLISVHLRNFCFREAVEKPHSVFQQLLSGGRQDYIKNHFKTQGGGKSSVNSPGEPSASAWLTRALSMREKKTSISKPSGRATVSPVRSG